MVDARVVKPRFFSEAKDFLRFIVRPRFAPRLPPRRAVDGWYADWFPAVPVGRLVQWACVLWAINLFFLGPIALMAATAGGAETRLDLWNIPWLTALIWAPVVEELVFRYGLRHMGQALWLVPAALVAMLLGARWYSILLLLAVLAVCWVPVWRGWSLARRTLSWRLRLRCRTLFPWLFHLSCLLFAGAHLVNFSYDQTPYWLMPLLVLPQWLTGMVLGWMRIRRGVGASMLLHAIFNAGPLAIIWLALHTAPQLLT